MTRTDVKALSGPQAAETAAKRGSSRVARRLMVLPVALLLAVAPAAPALASEGLSGYSTTPKSGTAPSKTTKTPTTTTPAAEPAPSTASSVPTTTTTPKASTLPFTGFDLRWTVGGGLLLMAMGFSLVTLQRRERRGSGR